MLGVNRDIMIRTASLIAVFLFFTAQGARAGDMTLAANAVLNNFLLISAFFLDGFANAAQQLCGHACGAREIVDSPGVPKGSFYNYFKAKELLAVEVLGIYWKNIAIDMLSNKSIAPVERIRDFLLRRHDYDDDVAG